MLIIYKLFLKISDHTSGVSPAGEMDTLTGAELSEEDEEKGKIGQGICKRLAPGD